MALHTLAWVDDAQTFRGEKTGALLVGEVERIGRAAPRVVDEVDGGHSERAGEVQCRGGEGRWAGMS